MVINFDRYLEKQVERKDYRQKLVDEIIAYYREHQGEFEAESFYLQHVRVGFPISILENIRERLTSQRVSNQ